MYQPVQREAELVARFAQRHGIDPFEAVLGYLVDDLASVMNDRYGSYVNNLLAADDLAERLRKSGR